VHRKAKRSLSDLYLNGGSRLFERPISTSNLVRPDIDCFLSYSRRFFDKGQYSNDGPLVQELEARLASFHQVQHCISFSNGFWALVLAIRCLSVPVKKEVIIPSLTYRRLGDVVSWAGLVPRYCDVDYRSMACSVETVRPHVGPETALIIGVHPIINCCDAPELELLAEEESIPLLFDSVESAYETVNGKKVGSFGQAEVFSMHASKLINGFEGGYLTTNNADLANRLKAMRGFGFFGPDNVVELGTNAKLNEVHAAMALASFDGLQAQVDQNLRCYRFYQKQLSELNGIKLVEFYELEKTSFKNILVELTEEWPLSRKHTIDYLNSEGILARPYYSPALHMKSTVYPVVCGALPTTEYLSERYMLLPCGHLTSLEDIEVLVEFLSFLKTNSDILMGIQKK
jgi:dTDP-4-amino-4,6-dideoxygalactose transaminase